MDRLGGGSPGHSYAIEIVPTSRATPTARILPAGRYEDHAVIAARGARAGFRLAVTGLQPKSRIRLRGLPKACRSREHVLVRGRNVFELVVEAAADAPLSCARLSLEYARPGAKTWQRFDILQPLVLVRVANQQPYLTVREDHIPFAVARALPFAIQIAKPKAELLQASPMSLLVNAVRKPVAMKSGGKKTKGKTAKPKLFAAPLRVRVLELPHGVRGNPITVSGDRAGLYLSAATSAGLGEHRVHVVARVSARGGFFEVTSPPVTLRTAARHNRVELGTLRESVPGAARDFELPVKHSVARAWNGTAKLELRGIPKGVTLLTKTLSAKQTLRTLRLRIAPGTRPGRYRNLVLRWRIPSAQAGGSAIEDWRGGELRLDHPAPRTIRASTRASAQKTKERP